MTPLEHQQIAEVNAQWRNMNTPKDIEAVKRTLIETGYFDKGDADLTNIGHFIKGFDAAIAYLSEPGAMRFFANESITKENEALKGQLVKSNRDTTRLDWWAANSRDYWFENPHGDYWIVYISKGGSRGGVIFVEGDSLRDVTDKAIARAEAK